MLLIKEKAHVLCLFAIMNSLICSMKHKRNFNYVITLSCELNNRSITQDLQFRTQVFICYNEQKSF